MSATDVPGDPTVALLVVVAVVLAYVQYRGVFADGTVGEHDTDPDHGSGSERGPGPASGWRVARTAPSAPAVLSAVGVALLGAGIAVWIRPELVPAGVARGIERITDARGTPFLLLGGLVAAAALLVITFGSRPTAQHAVGSHLNADPPEGVDRSVGPLTGERVDDLIDGIASREGRGVAGKRAETREYLRGAVVESVVTYRGWSRARAVESVDRGEWTERADVAAFVGGKGAPDMPLWWALRDWLSAEPAYVRRVRRTVAELDRQAAGGD